MSLTSIFDENRTIRDGLRARIQRPKLKFGPIKAPPLTTNYATVGSAFDYLVRFLAKKLNPFAESSVWIAEATVQMMGEGAYTYDLDRGALTQTSNAKRKAAARYIKEAKSHREAFLKGGVITNELITSGLRLAYLDIGRRRGVDYIDWKGLQSVNPRDIEDLRVMLGLLDRVWFKAKEVCLLNPTFGSASELVNGADADLLIDDCLIDLKCTKEPALDLSDLLQLVGYYLLHELGGIDCGKPSEKAHQVNRLGIYYARFGYLWIAPASEMLPADSLRDTAKWFFESICGRARERAKYCRRLRGPAVEYLKYS